MDPSLLAYAHSEQWERLSKLASKRVLRRSEISEFQALYRAASKDLSRVQTVAPDSEIAARLSNILLRSRQQFTGVPTGFKATALRFFMVGLPAALWRVRWYFLGSFAFFLLISVGTTMWFLNDPAALFAYVDPETAQQLAEKDFVQYYKENPNSIFAVGVWTNNAWIALQWVAFGITGIYVVLGLISNAFNVGLSGAALIHYGHGQDFFFYILPHGVPELSCIFLAAGAGLKIFTAWIIPRNMTRAQALAAEGRALITVGLGLVIFLFLSGLIEGFITPSNLPFGVKMIFGAALTVGVVIYAILLGRPAAAAGITGDLREEQTGYRVVTAA